MFLADYSITEKTFYKVSFAFGVLASISRWTTGIVRLNWNLGQSFEYLSYFMVGYSIRKIFTVKNSQKAIILIGTRILFGVCAAGLEYRKMIDEIVTQNLKYQIVAPYCPLIVLPSICIFIGFTLLDVKKEYDNLSALTFYIYLIHAGVGDVIKKMFQIVFMDLD